MEDKLKYATEREKEAYKLRQEGKTYKTIGEEMGITPSRAQVLVKNAERRIRGYEAYCERVRKQRKKDLEIYDLKISYGELKIIDREACKSKFPYEYFLMNDALKNITETLDLPTYLYNIR